MWLRARTLAVALTDLAALHSEEENFAAAQPLYERALRIQEKTLGAEHQDTVQTLTDLAICHLDQDTTTWGGRCGDFGCRSRRQCSRCTGWTGSWSIASGGRGCAECSCASWGNCRCRCWRRCDQH